jgi:channel protein (hemolysin III family)
MTVHPIPGFAEPVNSLMHLLAAGVFAWLGLRLLKLGRGDRLRLSLLGVFAFTSVFMLSMSGVYHMLDAAGAGSAVMFRLDKAAIFALIAGTFTPIHGMIFRGFIRWGGIALMWAAAATGITLVTIFFDQMPYGLGTTLYLALGWVAGVSVIAAWRRRGFRYIRLILIGGVAYSAGAILLGLKWPTLIPGVVGPHEMWHAAVIAGMCCHWVFVARQAREASGATTMAQPHSRS